MQNLTASDLTASVDLNQLKFSTTADLIVDLLNQPDANKSSAHAWIAQADAKKAAMFGLQMQQAGFNLLVLGVQGSGRTSLMQSAMREVAMHANTQTSTPLQDLVAIYHFERSQQATLIKLPCGLGAKLRTEMDQFSRLLMLEMPKLVEVDKNGAEKVQAEAWLTKAIADLEKTFEPQLALFNQYFQLIKHETLAYLSAWKISNTDAESGLENLINEAFFARFRVNVLVDHAALIEQGLHRPVVYDNDPSAASLFGGLDSTADSTSNPEFTRLRAGHLHKADGGMLLLHLRDLLSDEANGAQIIEKLHRFLRNGSLQIEDASGAGQSTTCALSNTAVTLQIKLVLIATREDFYDCLDQNPDFFDYFPIKVEFAERVSANAENYAAIAGFIAQKCVQHNCQHFERDAVASLIGALQRLEEDQARISTNFAFLERLMLESAAFAQGQSVVTAAHVQAAMQAKSTRNQYFEAQIRDSIIDNELLIQVQGEVVGQVNGLTHIELGDASFGSPIRITARCYPGAKGLINIDREVNMSGPNHDKGIFILQNWLSASFSHLAPLSLNASLVFEQEYNGVEGDSASCAELFALLSALANLPINQGIAVTGALNQFGEVMPVGGLNEKIEGYFRVCLALGLTGKQGVIIPKRNQRHLLLDKAVIAAVAAGQFHIITIDHVLEGIAYLTGVTAGKPDIEATVMGHANATLSAYRKTLESNQPQKH